MYSHSAIGLAAIIAPMLIAAAPLETTSLSNRLEARFTSDIDECFKSDFMETFQWTGKSGNDGDEEGSIETFCDTKYEDGYVVTGIETWKNKHEDVNAIRLYYSNGDTSKVYGKQLGSSTLTTWSPTERVEKMAIFGNGKAEYVGGFHFSTAGEGGTEGHHGKTEEELSSQTPGGTAVGAGILLGMQVALEKDPDYGPLRRLGFMWLGDKIESAVESDFEFDDTLENLNARKEGIKTSDLSTTYYVNKRDTGNTTVNFINQIEKKESWATSSSNEHSITAGVEYKYEADLIVAKASIGISFQYGFTHVDTKSHEWSDGKLLRWEASGNIVKPGEAIRCTATAQTGEFNGDYTSTTTVKLANGKSWSFKNKGTLESVGWSEAFSSCDDVDPDDVPLVGGDDEKVEECTSDVCGDETNEE